MWFGLYVLIRPVDRKEFEGRTFPHAYDVLVYQESGHVYAKDKNGNVICSDSPTACIQESINYLNNLGGNKILIKSGIYNVGDIYVSRSNTIIESDYATINGNIVVQSPNNIDWLYFVTIRSINLNGSISLRGCKNCIVEDVKINANGRDGLILGQVNDTGLGTFLSLIKNVYIHNCSKCIYFPSIANENNFINLTIEPIDNGTGVYIDKGGFNIFIGTTINGGSKVNTTGIYVNDSYNTFLVVELEDLTTGINISANVVNINLLIPLFFNVSNTITGNLFAVTSVSPYGFITLGMATGDPTNVPFSIYYDKNKKHVRVLTLDGYATIMANNALVTRVFDTTPSDSLFLSPVDGTIVLNSATNQLCARINATWKCVTLT